MKATLILKIAMAVFYIGAGINHFYSPSFYRPMMPPWMPSHEFLISLSGVAEILLGAALLWRRTQTWAAWGIVLMLISFFSIHIYMYQVQETVFPDIPKTILVGRFFLQFGLIYWAWIYTRVTRKFPDIGTR